MSRRKKFLIYIIVLAVFAVSCFYIILDFSRYFSFHSLYQICPNSLIKRIIVLLTAALVFIAGKDSYNVHDLRRMKLIFLVICCGEMAFLFERPIAAIFMFSLCHILLILRNGIGLSKIFNKENTKIINKLKLAALMLSLVLSAILTFFYPMLHTGLFFIAFFYGIILSVSLWVGLASYLLSLFPKINGQMIAWGMVCFYGCDLLVGMEIAATKGTLLWIVANSAVWIFYSPALLLLALSSYKYD